MVTVVWADLVAAFRSLRRAPVVVTTGIGTLGLGIGASAALFSLVHAVVIRPLPFRDPDRLVRIGSAMPVPAFTEWRAGARAFDDVALFGSVDEPTVLGVDGASLQAQQTLVGPNFFACSESGPRSAGTSGPLAWGALRARASRSC